MPRKRTSKRGPNRRRRFTRRQVVELIGPEAAITLLSVWGGHRLPALRAEHVELIRRDQRIRDALETSASGRQIAAREHLSPVRVHQIGKQYA